MGKMDRYMEKMKLDHFVIPYTNINPKWFNDLNVRSEIIKLLEESVSSKLPDMSVSSIFLDMFPQSRKTKEKINRWDFTKL